jgi:hypothetical protein
MSTRRDFLAAAASVPLLAAAPPSPQPTAPAPTPTPSAKKTSEAARALALNMREFDANLSDADIEKIAAGIDDNLKLGSRVNPHGTALKNWDEPATEFEVPV